MAHRKKSCPKCHKDNSLNYKFCHYCGTRLLEQMIEDEVEKVSCTKCGSINLPSTRFCTACGAPLISQPREEIIQTLHKYWYCEKDNVLMKETTSNHQFLISKDIEKSLQELVEKHKIRSEQKPLAEEIAQRVFEYDPKTNFSLLTKTRCPICMEDSLAPVYYQPRQEQLSPSPSTIFSPSQYMRPEQRITSTIPITTIHVERLTPMDMIENTIQILKQNPQILLITFLVIITDLVLNFTQISRYTLSSLPILFFQELYLEQGPLKINEVIVGIPIDLLIECLFITTLLVIFKEKLPLGYEKHTTPSTGILTQWLHFFPRIIITKLIIDGITMAIVIINLLLAIIVIMNIVDFMILSINLFMIPLVFLSILSSILLGLLLLFFAYVYPSIVMAEMGPIDSIVISLKFLKKYFWPTLVIIILFTIVPPMFLAIIQPEIIALGVDIIIMRLCETVQILCLAWGFEKFKSTLFRPSVTKAVDVN